MRTLSQSPLIEAIVVMAVVGWLRPVLGPIALAFYFAFVLTPPCDSLERVGLPRSLAVVVTGGITLALVAVLGTVLVAQSTDLVSRLDQYSAQIGQKVAGLRGPFQKVDGLTQKLTRLGKSVDPTGTLELANPVRVVSSDSLLQRMEDSVRPALEPLAFAGIVLVLTLFTLARREDLRGRLIRLVGTQNLTIATKTLDEVVSRISHLLLGQAYINAGFAAVIAGGLYGIRLPYALLWGVLAGLLRFVPLLGPLVATLLPATMAFAIFPGWWQVGATLALFAAVDLLVANVVEPFVLGKRSGVSALALLVSALFWTWLWGPLGLVLAAPLTICATVVGRHVPRLSFLTTLLGAESALNVEVDFYQRLLASDVHDATRVLERAVASTTWEAAVDEVVLPTLSLMANDLHQGAIDELTADRVVSEISQVVQRLRQRFGEPRLASPGRITLGIPAQSSADSLLLELLGISLRLHEGAVELMPVSPGIGAQALAEQVAARRPQEICIVALPPIGNVHSRFLSRRLRKLLPDTRITVLLPTQGEQRGAEWSARLREAGASVVYGTLRDMVASLQEPGASVESVGLAPVRVRSS